MDEVQSMKVGIRVGEKKKLPSKFFKNDENKAFVINSNKAVSKWFFKRRIPEPTQFFALGVLYLWARIPNNQFLIGKPMGTADQWLSS